MGSTAVAGRGRSPGATDTEHYLIDILLGWTYAAVTVYIVSWAWERPWAVRARAEGQTGGTETQPEPEAEPG